MIKRSLKKHMEAMISRDAFYFYDNFILWEPFIKNRHLTQSHGPKKNHQEHTIFPSILRSPREMENGLERRAMHTCSDTHKKSSSATHRSNLLTIAPSAARKSYQYHAKYALENWFILLHPWTYCLHNYFYRFPKN